MVLLGNWIRYAGARAGNGHYGVVMFGQILVGLAQPFVLAAPTRYSDLWFTSRGRISATAIATLANPLGGAVRYLPQIMEMRRLLMVGVQLGQLIVPFWVAKEADVPNMVLYVAIIVRLPSATRPPLRHC